MLTYDRVTDRVAGLISSAASAAVYFTSDTHFSHKLSRLHELRGVANAAEMDDLLVENWNAVVRREDVVYHLGDFALCGTGRLREILGRLHGRIIFIPGNHDRRNVVNTMRAEALVLAPKLHDIEVDGLPVILCHYPILSWDRSRHGSWHLHGHQHGSALPVQTGLLSLDVGVDCNNLAPVSWDQICVKMGDKIRSSDNRRLMAESGIIG